MLILRLLFLLPVLPILPWEVIPTSFSLRLALIASSLPFTPVPSWLETLIGEANTGGGAGFRIEVEFELVDAFKPESGFEAMIRSRADFGSPMIPSFSVAFKA